MQESIKRLGNFLLDTIFPIECIGCKKEGEWLCERCAGRIAVTEQNECLVCKTSAARGRTCFTCRREFPLARALRAMDYDDPRVKYALKLIKYNYVKTLLYPLIKVALPYFVDSLAQNDIDPRALIFTPVPLHPRRLRERGFNQSEIIARAVASECGAKLIQPLARRRFTMPQVDLDEQDRRSNIKGAFVCSDAESVKDRYVVVVDDVTTTGATLAECAEVLLSAGAKEIWGLTLAKG